MQLKLTTQSFFASDKGPVINYITSRLNKELKRVGLDYFESRLDVICLDIAKEIKYVYERNDNEIKFTCQKVKDLQS